ncbi:MAG: hypothetical protein ABIQ30_16420 [Devosia sp.]
MNPGHALSTAFKIGTARKLQPGDTDDSEQIGWLYAIVGIVLLVVVQFTIFVVASGGLTINEFRDLSIVMLISLGAPFVIFLVAALMTGKMARLPAAFFYLGILLSLVQIVSLIVQNISSGSSFILGATVVLVATAARGFLKFGWVGTLVVAILVAAAIIGAGFLLLQLPTGRYLT